MTTIATDGKVMAADRLVTGNGIAHGEMTKIHRAENGDVIGCCGSAFKLLDFVDWYNSDQKQPFNGESDDFEALVLTASGEVRCYDHTGRYIIETLPAASGSGSAVALGAMDAGAGPIQAVSIACGRDVYSGGKSIDSLARLRQR